MSNPEQTTDSLATLVAPGAEPRRLATGFGFTEGPIWRQELGALDFSDIPGNTRRRWHPVTGISVLRRRSDKCNGMTLDNDRNLIVCEHATSSVVRERRGQREIVASHWQGAELNSPNDVIVARDGSIYFTDPWYGRMPVFGVERPRELDFQGVYRVDGATGDLELVVDDFAMPNGLCLTRDESQLFVNDTPRAHIRVFDVAPDGSLENGRLFFEGIGSAAEGEAVVDGMKLDERGNVYVTGPGGIWVISPAGAYIGTIQIPETVGNLNWGGSDWRTLYICASTSLYALELAVAGNRLGYMA